jgi:CHAT domain-containing protein
VLGLRVHSPLVFLSGCETGVGAEWATGFARGEDYTTMAQAFLYAGAADVVATLWRIEDEGAAAFAEHFYRGLRRGSAPDALTRAQRALRGDARYSAPYYWAGYRISGGADTANAAHNSDLLSVDLN